MRMKALSILLLLSILIVMDSHITIAADASIGSDFNSAYVWRGITFNDGWVAQPSINVTSSNGFGVNVWGNLDMEDDFDPALESGEFSEIDLTLSYGRKISAIDISAGYIEYLFPAGTPGTREIYVSLGGEPMKGLTIGVDTYYDIDEVKDVYASVRAAYAVDVAEGLGVKLGASAGYAGKDASTIGKAGMHDYALSLSTSYSVSDALSIGAKVAYTDTLDEDVLPEQDVNTCGGASVSYAY
jgi:hypothetical protein